MLHSVAECLTLIYKNNNTCNDNSYLSCLNIPFISCYVLKFFHSTCRRRYIMRLIKQSLFRTGEDEFMVGGKGNNIMRGQSGDDNIRGGNLDDDIFGGDGNDVISGGPGEDEISDG